MQDIAPQRLWLAVGVLFICLLVTGLAALYTKAEVEAAAQKEFDFTCNEIQLNIAGRLSSSALVLYSGAALFDASNDVTRLDWQKFIGNLRIEQQMPGTQGIGYALLIPPAQLAEHIRQIRSEGFPDYQVQPEGERERYTSIVYLEPFTGRNLRAFGYDMFSEPIRRAAMERARDENTAALSGKVILVQETNEDVQAGVLMYAPVYRHEAPIQTVEARRAALKGWVYSPYRMDDLMRGTLGNYELKRQDRHITLQIYDGEWISTEALLYDSRNIEERARAITPADISKAIQVSYFGRLWTLNFTQIGGLASFADYNVFWLVFIGGTCISLLIFGLLISLLRTGHYLESIKLLAETDALTGVFNRRKILELAQNEYIRAKRQHHSLTILMIDLNFFKHINDTYGHAVGDHALRQTANAIQEALRKEIDRVGRFGGDEFLVILPETGLDQVDLIFQRLRTSVASTTQNIAAGMGRVSISIGAAELDDSTLTLQDLIERADQSMYTDKKQAVP